MSFYILLLCVVICSSCCVSFARQKQIRLIAKFVTFSIMFIPAAIRYGIGVDYNNYVYIFNKIAHSQSFGLVESGWGLLSKIVFTCGGDAQVLIALTALLSLFFFFEEVESEKWFIYAPVFICIIYTWLFTTLRQILTMCMIFNALLKYQKGMKLRAIFIAILSYFIHKSALFYIPIAFLVYFLKCNKICYVVLFFILYVLGIFFFPHLVASVLDIIGMTVYSSYLIGNAAKWLITTEVAISSGLGRLLRYFCYLCIILAFPIKKSNRYIMTLFLLYVSTDFMAQSIIILNRIGRGIIFLFAPMAYEAFTAENYKQIRFLTICCCIFILFFFDLINGFHGSIPYKTIFYKF